MPIDAPQSLSLRREGTTRWIEIRADILTGSGRPPVRLLGTNIGITEKKCKCLGTMLVKEVAQQLAAQIDTASSDDGTNVLLTRRSFKLQLPTDG